MSYFVFPSPLFTTRIQMKALAANMGKIELFFCYRLVVFCCFCSKEFPLPSAACKRQCYFILTLPGLSINYKDYFA